MDVEALQKLTGTGLLELHLQSISAVLSEGVHKQLHESVRRTTALR